MNEKIKTLYLLRGVSGAGKTTLAKTLAPNAHFAADDYFEIDGKYQFDSSRLGVAHLHCLINTHRAMKLGEIDIAVHNTFTRQQHLQDYFDLAEKYGYKTVVLVVENYHSGVNVHNVPDCVLERQEEQLRKSLKLR